MDSFLQLGETGEELTYFKEMIDSISNKTNDLSYAERRAQEINGETEDVSLEGKQRAELTGWLSRR